MYATFQASDQCCFILTSETGRDFQRCIVEQYNTKFIYIVGNTNSITLLCVQKFSEQRFFAFISLCADLSHNDHQNLIHL